MMIVTSSFTILGRLRNWQLYPLLGFEVAISIPRNLEDLPKRRWKTGRGVQHNLPPLICLCNQRSMSVIPPTPQVFSTAKTNESSTTSSLFKPTSNSTQKFPSFPPPPSSVVPHPPVARAAPSAVPRAPSAVPRPPSATPHPPSPTPTLPTYPLLSVPHARSVKSTAPTLHDTLRKPLPT